MSFITVECVVVLMMIMMVVRVDMNTAAVVAAASGRYTTLKPQSECSSTEQEKSRINTTTMEDVGYIEIQPDFSLGTSGVHANRVPLADPLQKPEEYRQAPPQLPLNEKCDDDHSANSSSKMGGLSVPIRYTLQNFLWSNAILPYIWHSRIDPIVKQWFIDAMIEISSRSSIRFRRVSSSASQYVVLRSDRGCYSRYTGNPFNIASAATFNRLDEDTMPYSSVQIGSCATTISAAHELFHVLYAQHTHLDNYRNRFVKVHIENIVESQQSSFNVVDSRFFHVQGRDADETTNGAASSLYWDYRSCMHYQKRAFIRPNTPNNALTIETLNPRYQNVIGQRTYISSHDIMRLEYTYSSRATYRYYHTNHCKHTIKILIKYVSLDNRIRMVPDSGDYVWIAPGATSMFLFASHSNEFWLHTRTHELRGGTTRSSSSGSFAASDTLLIDGFEQCETHHNGFGGRVCFKRVRTNAQPIACFRQ